MVVGVGPAPLSLVEALVAVRRTESHVQVALPVAGDPLGLAGPSTFNTAAIDAGEALVLPIAGIGLVPTRVGGAIEWCAMPAEVAPPFDPREARQLLKQRLREVTEDLVALQVTRWNTDIPDLLMNGPAGLNLPTDLIDGDSVRSAAQCLAIIEAATAVEPGALTAAERAQFETAMRDLDRAARRVLVAACSVGSDNLSPS